MKSVMNEVWMLYFTLQFMGYLYYYGILYPANADIFNENLISLIEFKAINPLNLIKHLDPDFDLDSYIGNAKSALGTILHQYMIPIIIISALILLFLVLTFARLLPMIKDKVD